MKNRYKDTISISSLLMRLIMIISIIELIIMVFFSMIDLHLSSLQEALLDSSLLAVLSSPFIYIFILRPYRNSLDDSFHELMSIKEGIDAQSLVSITDVKGNILFANNKFCEISGYSSSELIGSNHRILNSQNQPKSYWREMYLCVSQGNNWNDDIKNIAKDGHVYWVTSTIVPIIKDNKLSGYCSIRTDITERLKQRSLLEKSKIKAEHDAILKSQFLSTMSHEIRTPMNGVIGMAHLLNDTKLDDEQRDYLEAIISSGNSLMDIINDILDFSKLEAGKVELECIQFDLERLCSESLLLLDGSHHHLDKEYILDYQNSCSRHYVGDPSRIRQILMNLLGNANKFTKTGFIRLTVSCLDCDSTSTTVHFEIEDTGIGIKKDQLSNLFNEFTQADTATTREFGGTGLGLSITKQLINLFNGEINVRSNQGKGSIFSFNIELKKSDSKHSDININLQTLENYNILIVDDNPLVCDSLKNRLQHCGAKVDIETNPNSVIETLDDKDNSFYKIIIIDQYMPNKSGIELGKEIRSLSKYDDLKMIILSSAGHRGDALSYQKAGFNAYIDKINQTTTLSKIIKKVTEHHTGKNLITQHSIAEELYIEDSTEKFSGNILVAEDVKANQIIANKFLTKLGLNVTIAENGHEAVKSHQLHQYDLIFMDCRMPLMDGYEATRQIRNIEEQSKLNQTPVIALTANATNEDVLLCAKAGMNDVITKPFKPVDLTQCLKKWLPNKH